jgi:hypothetical protein
VGALRKLGSNVAKSTVEKYRVRPAKQASSPTWKTLLKNHVPDLVALDVFVVPTVTFRVLHVLVILAHERRRVGHFHLTAYPTAAWTAQQVVEGPALAYRKWLQAHGKEARYKLTNCA